ncbi:sister chromatid cohesion 1 protein 2 [Abrus precatorius]|uniref:Sister chromatid cohesion 1 protein 2 n=1 Tax=Abrus precatorius TaxID=3816 RepID=A0A8B8L7S6_ABRPR|nr:sister chromatid cohesion 1 protein 2 [Abrus precatorius]
MLNSELVIGSIRRSPLWVAAFCLKNLKKSHVFETDISSSVEKILQDKMDVVSYRVLAYLLLGVVRIYSKKVEYLFHDCNEVLIKINKFVTNTKDHAHVETLRMSVTIPDRFELDAFDLDILEDADGGHIAPQEEITLKDVLCKTEGFGRQFSQEKFEEFDVDENTCSSDHLMLEGDHLSHLLNMDLDDCPPNSPINLLESRDIFQSSIFSQKEPMNVDTVLTVEGVEKESICLFAQDQQINDQTVQEIVLCEDEIHEERSRISQEEYRDISMLSGTENEPVLFVEAFNESHQVDNNIAVKETSSSLSQMNQETIEVQKARSFQESIERPRDEKSYGEECMHQGKSSAAKEILEDLIEGTVEKLSFIPPQSKNLDVTPQSKFQGGSVGRPKAGSTTPDFMLISTPAVRERARSSTKRKIVLDEMIVLPNEVLRKSIHDASDLVSNRRKFRCTLLALQRESLIPTLPDRLYESLLPCYSSELRHLFSKKKMKILNSLEIVETLEKVDMSESQTVGSPEHIATTPQTPPHCPGSLVIEETPRKLDVSESQASGSPEHVATAPQTPPLCQKIKVRPTEHPQRTEIQNSNNLGPSSPHESIEGEQSFERNVVLNLMEEERISCGTEDSELLAGWSERTRKVASFLDQSFLHASKKREGHVMNFSQVLGGRLRKECARLFYEILVLSTTGYVDVQQNKAYGDIAISKHSKLDQTFRFDSLLNDVGR